MASSEDFKKLYELYQTEGVPNGVSIVDFCQRNGVVYNQFERWFKKQNRLHIDCKEIRCTRLLYCCRERNLIIMGKDVGFCVVSKRRVAT